MHCCWPPPASGATLVSDATSPAASTPRVFAVYAETPDGDYPAEVVGVFDTEAVAQEYADQYPAEARAMVRPLPVLSVAPRRVSNYSHTVMFSPGDPRNYFGAPMVISPADTEQYAEDEGSEGPGWVFEPAAVQYSQPGAEGMYAVSVRGTDAEAVRALLLSEAREHGYVGD